MAPTLTASGSGWAIGIVVPARDEATSLEACLASILDAAVPPGAQRWIVLVADRCTDATALLGEQLLAGGGGEVVVSELGNVGAARRAGAAAALDHFARLGRRDDEVWLLGTDADSTVPEGWIESHLRQADAGVVGVAGTVSVASFAEHPPQVATAHLAGYVLHADGTHPHVHGTNLGVRGDAYLAVGGWLPLLTGEDHDLWGRLRSRGHRVISTIESPVVTSGRRVGRAPEGFADHLTGLSAVDEGALR